MVAERPLLLVDDEPDLTPLLARQLVRSGYLVVVCRDGSGALAAFEGRQWAAAVIDLTLPDIAGADLARRILSSAPDLGIVFTSGMAFDPPALAAVRPNQIRFVQKPFRFADLSTALAAVTSAAR